MYTTFTLGTTCMNVKSQIYYFSELPNFALLLLYKIRNTVIVNIQNTQNIMLAIDFPPPITWFPIKRSG